MNLIKHICKNHLISILSLGFLIVFATTLHILAGAPSGGYAPGDTLNPGCLPTDLSGNCKVTIPSGGWSLTGNDGTSSSNFIGTKNISGNEPLNFKVNNQKAGMIDPTLNNTFLGYRVAESNTAGRDNTFIGYYAGGAETDGTYNTYVGSYGDNGSFIVGGNIKIGTGGWTSGLADIANNIAIGNQASRGNHASNNIAIGGGANAYNSTGANNVDIGTESGGGGGNWGFPAVSNNTVAIGYEALRNVKADNNTAVGFQAGYSNTTGTANTFSGHLAGYSNSTGTNSTFLGFMAGYNSTGTENTYLGSQAANANTSGTTNVVIGRLAGSTNTYSNVVSIGGYTVIGSGANYATAIGAYSSADASSGTAIGGSAISSGVGTALGSSAYSVSGVSVGAGAGLHERGNYNTYVGNSNGRGSGDGVPYDRTTSGNTALGYQSAYSLLTGADNNTFIGTQAGYGNTIGGGNTVLGYQAAHAGNLTFGLSKTVAIGYQALYNDVSHEPSDNIGNLAIGYQSGFSNTTGLYNTFIGQLAGYSDTISGQNTFIGYQAGYNNTGMFSAYNTFIGSNAGYSNTGGADGVFIGTNAGYKNQGGINSTIIGFSAGQNNTTNHDNTIIGSYAGYSGDGYRYTVAIGENAGFSLDGGTTQGNVLVGYNSGVHSTVAAQNTFIGTQSGGQNVTGGGNVFLGYYSGSYETGSNKLFIDNQDRTDEATARTSSLIYGQFNSTPSSQILTVNGALNVSENIDTSSGFSINTTPGITDCFENATDHITITGGIITAITAGTCPP